MRTFCKASFAAFSASVRRPRGARVVGILSRPAQVTGLGMRLKVTTHGQAQAIPKQNKYNLHTHRPPQQVSLTPLMTRISHDGVYIIRFTMVFNPMTDNDVRYWFYAVHAYFPITIITNLPKIECEHTTDTMGI